MRTRTGPSSISGPGASGTSTTINCTSPWRPSAGISWWTGGRFSYAGEMARRFRRTYATHAAGHNVILVDGHGQGPGSRRFTEPVRDRDHAITGDLDLARGFMDRFDQLEGRAVHTRTVCYVRGAFWIVLDRIETDRPRRIDVLWHWHPGCTVKCLGNRCLSVDADRGNLAIRPVGETAFEVEIVKGREKPSLQGWYSRKYNEAVPSPTSIYTSRIEGSRRFAWILIPGKGAIPDAEASMKVLKEEGVIRFDVALKGKRFEVTIPLNDLREATLSTTTR